MNTAAAPAPDQPTPAVTDKPEIPDPKVLAEQARAYYAMQFLSAGDKERKRIGLAKGLLTKDSNMTIEELRALVPLPGDTMRYAKDANGKERIATDKYGLTCFPKQRGRRKPHMSDHAHAIKNKSIAIFRSLFTIHAQEAQIRAKNDGVEFNGIPTDDISKLGARAAVLATAQVKTELRAAKNRARNRQQLSRRINNGLQPRNTNVRSYIGA